jgi:HEAT repeat protein
MIEINIDAWENARREIIACNGHAMSFLQATLMDSTDVEFRRVAARMLALLHYKDSIATLIEALKDNDAIVRNEAILALTKQPSDVVATHILDLANSINGC